MAETFYLLQNSQTKLKYRIKTSNAWREKKRKKIKLEEDRGVGEGGVRR